ncbi:hypothetical protein [Endozoicomonas euniceicola]|uniref:Uncharacterized protein n=1 Tax=Endozoicomonas euniceicola TaxID=1234143 RepID=A0ABY6H081_9GAMM|nr:hypothetical protein [Endozoicomonas euniceicola]UYM18447.1 hypothetical protein NX720_11275 [Endozoicomonas euniceicola]
MKPALIVVFSAILFVVCAQKSALGAEGEEQPRLPSSAMIYSGWGGVWGFMLYPSLIADRQPNDPMRIIAFVVAPLFGGIVGYLFGLHADRVQSANNHSETNE